MRVRRFNDAGLLRFEQWLALAQSQHAPIPPTDMLEDAEMTCVLEQKIEVEQQQFPRRFEAAKYLYEILRGHDLNEPERDKGLWAWLTVYFWDVVCPVDGKGKRHVMRLERYYPQVEIYTRYYKHLLLGPYVLYAAHADDPERAMCVLANPVDKPGDVVESIASRKYIATSAAMVAVATVLFTERGAYKRGAQDADKSKQRGGTSRRLAKDFGEQIDRTYDLHLMDRDSLVSILPKEFKKWLR